MIGEIMNSINRHFPRSIESFDAVVADGITGNFGEDYVAGQYIMIKRSILNDGVYKLAAVTSSKLTVEETLQPEAVESYMVVYGLAIPTDFLTLVADIESWQSSNGGKEGIASESIDSYSVSFGSGGANGNGGNTWTQAFASRLGRYRRLYDDVRDFDRKYGWQNRDYC